MSGVKISDLPAATTPLSGSEIFPVVQSGVTSQTTLSTVLQASAGTAEAYGGMLIRNPLPASNYSFRQWVDGTLVNPYPGIYTPANGTNSVASVDMLTNQQYLPSATSYTTAVAAAFVLASNQWPNNSTLGQWVFMPVMFTRSIAIRYIATQAFQTGSGVFGTVRIQVFASSPTTYTPTTMLSDGGIQTLPVNTSSGNYPAAGSYLTCPVIFDAVAGTQYWVAVNFGMNNGTATNSVNFQTGLLVFNDGMQLNTRLVSTGTSNKIPFWWTTSLALNTTPLGSNPVCTNINTAVNTRLPKLYFMT